MLTPLTKNGTYIWVLIIPNEVEFPIPKPKLCS